MSSRAICTALLAAVVAGQRGDTRGGRLCPEGERPVCPDGLKLWRRRGTDGLRCYVVGAGAAGVAPDCAALPADTELGMRDFGPDRAMGSGMRSGGGGRPCPEGERPVCEPGLQLQRRRGSPGPLCFEVSALLSTVGSSAAGAPPRCAALPVDVEPGVRAFGKGRKGKKGGEKQGSATGEADADDTDAADADGTDEAEAAAEAASRERRGRAKKGGKGGGRKGGSGMRMSGDADQEGGRAMGGRKGVPFLYKALMRASTGGKR